MDLPITVMIVLFVSLVVGAIVIVFSNTILQNAEHQMPNIDGDTLQDQIIQVEEVSIQMVSALASQCLEDNKASLDEELCVVLNSNNMIDVPQTNWVGVDASRYIPNRHTLYMYYYGSQNEVILKS